MSGHVDLAAHLEKTSDTAIMLWETWLPGRLRERVDRRLLSFLAYAHDIGKASPAFQTKRGCKTPELDEKILGGLRRAGFPLRDNYPDSAKARHELVSHVVLKRHGFDDSVCVVAGGHHGKPPNAAKIAAALDACRSCCGFDEDAWVKAQDSLVAAALEKSGYGKIPDIKLARAEQVLYSGILILADWLASSEDAVELPPMWKPSLPADAYRARFRITAPRPVQDALLQSARAAAQPGIHIVEAPMGEGKTEAALAAAEALAEKCGCRGIYFALPSQATSNAMLKRVVKWMGTFDRADGPLSMRLSHGKAELNEQYEGIKLASYMAEGESGATVHDWLVGRKKGILADFAIGTIDHVLMAGLKQKHLALRHLGLANKVLIIDECHAYDVYMESYLLTALRWLGAYGVPVVVLSATLPPARRAAIVREYLNQRQKFGEGEEWTETTKYPLITRTDGMSVYSEPAAGRAQEVAVQRLAHDDLPDALADALQGGGCAGVILNTVRKAQETYKTLAEKFGSGNVTLLHSGFIYSDRARMEEELTAELGENPDNRPELRIVVGTQVFEQSLDIDFDVMFTELCPMDLLLQRIGRLHRHRRGRPEKLWRWAERVEVPF